MKTLDLKTIFKYMELDKEAPLGASKYAPIIIMVNEEKKILNDLNPSHNYYKNLWSFLDYAINHTFNEYDVEDVESALVNHIIFVLELFKSLDNKNTISGVEFIKVIREAK